MKWATDEIMLQALQRKCFGMSANTCQDMRVCRPMLHHFCVLGMREELEQTLLFCIISFRNKWDNESVSLHHQEQPLKLLTNWIWHLLFLGRSWKKVSKAGAEAAWLKSWSATSFASDDTKTLPSVYLENGRVHCSAASLSIHTPVATAHQSKGQEWQWPAVANFASTEPCLMLQTMLY